MIEPHDGRTVPEDHAGDASLVGASAVEARSQVTLPPAAEQHRPLSRAMFGDLYEQHVDRVYSYLYYRTGSHQDAEDLTARVFFQALRHLDRFDPSAGSVAAWLLTIARNVLANHRRSRARRPLAPLEAAAGTEDPAPAPTVRVEEEDDARHVREALRRLPPERQHLLLLKYVQNMSNADIGRAIGRNEGAVKSLLRRTLDALRRELEKEAHARV